MFYAGLQIHIKLNGVGKMGKNSNNETKNKVCGMKWNKIIIKKGSKNIK